MNKNKFFFPLDKKRKATYHRIMRKIVVILTFVLILTSCQYKIHEVVIVNKSNFDTYICAKNYQEGSKKILESNILIKAGEAVTIPFMEDGQVNIKTINRACLQKNDDLHYEILNAPTKEITVYNKTPDNIILTEVNNLFDTLTIMANSEEKINVYNYQKINVMAISENGFVAKTQIMSGGILISY